MVALLILQESRELAADRTSKQKLVQEFIEKLRETWI